MEEIVLRIEELRLELNKLSAYKRLADPEIIKASQELDEVLNQYNILLQKRATK
ncbi:aspartyl-phosphate phosphatase Spo0E family protein [Paenibacillus rhizophilus]|uniref:aspartyl-phosphate phosphatase Spo0E family protein n=1 Tax=Paenibacillus rhizophilus TaxID=1850366 RepID=UPI001C8AAD6B|nr:aspartyl-phosphate phosphatase Spo0E family protein [Paenibacillus rhizophilus]